MQTHKITLNRLHPGQERIHQEAKRFNVLGCGRRFGKTALGIDRLVKKETLPYPQAWFSPTYKMLLEVWREASEVLGPIIARRSTQERRLELITGGVIEFWSMDNPDMARGRKYRRVIGDEWAMVANGLEAWNMVIRPTLVDMAGDAWFLSTPKGRNGFWQMWTWGQDEQMPDWCSWQMPTSANPHIPASEVEAMRRTLPERVFQQEILAQFLEDAGGVFRRVMNAATGAQIETGEPGKRYAIGVDWGKSNDFTVFTVVDPERRTLVYMDRSNHIDYQLQMGRLSALLERFPPAVIIPERNSMGEPLIEQMQRQGWPVTPFTTTNASKAQAIDGLALAFERQEISILPDPVLVSELQAYEMTRLPSGMFRYGAPEGMHDDCVMSLALAWQGVSNYQPLLLFGGE